MSPSTPPKPPTPLTGRLQASSMQDSFAQPRAHRRRWRMFVVVMLLACAFKAIQADQRLEALRGAAGTRTTSLESGARGEVPVVRLLEPAGMLHEPWRQDYGKDAGLAMGASLRLSLLAVTLAELFSRPDAVWPTPWCWPAGCSVARMAFPSRRRSDSRGNRRPGCSRWRRGNCPMF